MEPDQQRGENGKATNSYASEIDFSNVFVPGHSVIGQSNASEQPPTQVEPQPELQAEIEQEQQQAGEVRQQQHTQSLDNMAHDSLVTVRLSEAPALQIDTSVGDEQRASRASTVLPPPEAPAEVEYSSRVMEVNEQFHGTDGKESPAEAPRNLQDELEECSQVEPSTPEPQGTSVINGADEAVHETEELPHEENEDDATTLLLAKLEQENTRLAFNPKSGRVNTLEQQELAPTPSMAQMREMAKQPTPPPLRYSVLPPPPMTDLEFYTALVKDYNGTAARLPTFLSRKIRKGVPPPLRGVVWQSMAGARDATLEEQYERLSGESSPHDPAILKDIGRSFPGVDMFREPDGDGQRMLGRVLKCYSLYDREIGYCQGLAFLVGPLLMHMPDKAAFCILVRLMDHYDLRSSFQPDLAGLHVRIFQFRELLRQHLPTLSLHLEDLQVDPAYVSQWFLSFFAVTCPLPMLFRIFDVLFAEGAAESLMRVALSLMRRNEARILAYSDHGDALQFLLSRSIWDCYQYNNDEFVDDFVNLSTIVTKEKLHQLELACRDADQTVALNDSANRQIGSAIAARKSDGVTTAASRFLGRIWTQTSSSTSSAPNQTVTINSTSNNKIVTAATLSPTALSAPPRPLSMLRRSASKQSLASTLNSMEASSASVVSSASTASTDATTVSRDSSSTDGRHESTVILGKTGSTGGAKNADEVRHLHGQIEDLLTALSELQREQAALESQLRKERDERQSDKEVVRPLLEELRKKTSTDSDLTTRSNETIKPTEPQPQVTPAEQPAPEQPPTEEKPQTEQVVQLVNSSDIYAQQGVYQYGTYNQQYGKSYTYNQNKNTNALGYEQPYVNPYDVYNQQQPAVNTHAIGEEVAAPAKTTKEQVADKTKTTASSPLVDEELLRLLETAEARFGLGAGAERENVTTASKSQLQEDLEHSKEETVRALAQVDEYSKKIYDLDRELNSTKEQLRESHAHCRTIHQDKQRLEKQIHAMRTRASTAVTEPAPSVPISNRMSVVGGLREFKLGRSRSSPTQNSGTTGFSKRMSSLPVGRESMMLSTSAAGGDPPADDLEALLMELVQAKTAEAIAKQEAEEAKQKLENFRKAYGLAPGEQPPSNAMQTASNAASQASQAAGAAAQAAMGMLGRFTANMNENGKPLTAAQAPASPAAVNGGFWGWRR